MQPNHTLTLLCLACASILSSARASAQDPRISDTADGYAVEFSDSDLLGQSLSLGGLLIPIRTDSPRILLIRPRASFVAELRHSIEDL
jgi:hypothetical protein